MSIVRLRRRRRCLSFPFPSPSLLPSSFFLFALPSPSPLLSSVPAPGVAPTRARPDDGPREVGLRSSEFRHVFFSGGIFPAVSASETASEPRDRQGRLRMRAGSREVLGTSGDPVLKKVTTSDAWVQRAISIPFQTFLLTRRPPLARGSGAAELKQRQERFAG